MIPPQVIMGAVQVGSSLLGGLMGSSSSKKAAKRAREIGRLNYKEFMRQADVEQDLGNAEIMNLLESNARHKGMVEGMYNKSGLLMTGTPANALDKMQRDFDFNVDQANESVKERVDRIQFQAKMSMLQANSQAAGYEEQAKGDMINSMFGILKGGAQIYGGLGSPTIDPSKGTSVDYGLFNPQMNLINRASTGNMLKGFTYKP